MLRHQHRPSHTKRPVLTSVGHYNVRNGAVVIYLAVDRLLVAVIITNGNPSAILWGAEEFTWRDAIVKHFILQSALDIFRCQTFTMLRRPLHFLHPFRRKRAVPLTVASVVIAPILLGVYHDKVPPIIHIRTNAAGAAISHTHFGSPSKDLSSLNKMSINSFIVVLF